MASASPRRLTFTSRPVKADVLSETQFPVAKKFLTDGGTILFVLGNTVAARSVGRLVGVDTATAAEAPTNSYAMFGRIDFEHPLFAPFADPRYSDFTKIHFWKHRQLDPEKIPGARILARFDNGDAAWIEVARE